MQSIPYSKEDTLSHDGDKRAKETSLEVKHLTKECSYMQSIPYSKKKILFYITEIII